MPSSFLAVERMPAAGREQKRGVLSDECGGIAVLEDKSWYDKDCGLVIKETGEGIFG